MYQLSLFLSFASFSYFWMVRSSTIPVRNKICPPRVDFPASTCPMKTTLRCSLGSSSESSTFTSGPSSSSSSGSGAGVTGFGSSANLASSIFLVTFSATSSLSASAVFVSFLAGSGLMTSLTAWAGFSSALLPSAGADVDDGATFPPGTKAEALGLKLKDGADGFNRNPCVSSRFSHDSSAMSSTSSLVQLLLQTSTLFRWMALGSHRHFLEPPVFPRRDLLTCHQIWGRL
mmetsp:Transcript_2614/g.16862  ORF Transcript_2614/g.16862 Transcript_2614/m.16862 type:complete len:231 (+) Transcript_2614:1950-2642(+)